jgi:hypothetical protein
MSKQYEGRPYHVVMFVSRNKDNSNLEHFKQRTKAFLTQKTPDELVTEFNEFCERGLSNELSRFYISVNTRKHDVILKSLQHYLIEHQDVNLASTSSLVASLSMKRGTALTKRFLFDYDDDPVSVGVFLSDVKQALGDKTPVELHKTVSGYAVVTERGFDTRDLLAKWENVELKRDGMLFVKAQKKLG